jgi:DNA-binding NarL/FixJ family response regulator
MAHRPDRPGRCRRQAVVERLQPDVVLMDLRMPGLGGAPAIRALAERGSSAKVLVLTT